jgi:hypothetical protein
MMIDGAAKAEPASSDRVGNRVVLRDGVAFDPAWYAIGKVAAFVAALALVAASILQAAADLDLLAPAPVFHRTSAGPAQDMANFFAAVFDHGHRILWNIAIRDTLFPIAFLALIVLGLAVRHLVGAHRAGAQLMELAFLIGGIFATLDPLTYLAETAWWRHGGWSAHPAASMIAAGRASDAIDTLTRFYQVAGLSVLAVALFLLGRVLAEDGTLHRGLVALAYVLAGGLVVAVAASVAEADTLFDVALVAFGIVLGPLFLVWLGRSIGVGGPGD